MAHGKSFQVYVDEKCARRLKLISKETERTEEELAACSVEEAALDFFRHRKDDPGDTVL